MLQPTSLTYHVTQEAELLAMLRQRPHTTADFCQTTLVREYPRVIWRLRHHKGYDIRAERLSRTSWRFTLVSEPSDNGTRRFGF